MLPEALRLADRLVSGVKETDLVIGQIAGVYGVKGWLKVKSFTEPADNILNYLPWKIESPAGLSVVEVDSHSRRPQGLVVHIAGIDDRDAASALARKMLYASADDLPALAESNYYWHQLLGLRVISTFGGESVVLGRVANLMETGANDVLVVQGDEHSIDAGERLVPYVPGQFVQRVDLVAGELWVDWDPDF